MIRSWSRTPGGRRHARTTDPRWAIGRPRSRCLAATSMSRPGIELMAHMPQSPGDSAARSLYAYAMEANEDEWQAVMRGVGGLVGGGLERLRLWIRSGKHGSRPCQIPFVQLGDAHAGIAGRWRPEHRSVARGSTPLGVRAQRCALECEHDAAGVFHHDHSNDSRADGPLTDRPEGPHFGICGRAAPTRGHVSAITSGYGPSCP